MIKVRVKLNEWNNPELHDARGFDEYESFGIGDDIGFVPESDHAAQQEFIIKTHDVHGTSHLILTDEDIEKLKNGQALVWGQGEYSTVLYYGEIEAE